MTMTNGAEVSQVRTEVLREFDHDTKLLGLSPEERDLWIAAKAARLGLQEEAQRRHADSQLGDVAERVESAWLDRDALANLPGPERLLGKLLFRRSFVVLAGEPGSFKSFVALDWAASVATGAPWEGHKAELGTVLYLAGEGDTGLPKRLRAWEQTNNHGAQIPVHVFPRPATLHKPDHPETRAVVESIVRRNPDLVVIDTLARYTPGMEENAAKDMGLFVQVASRIKDETGACVVVIHHTSRDGGNERGSTALRGASDALYMLKSPDKDRRTVDFYVDRSKEEASGGKPITLELEVVDLGQDDDGEPVTSLVIPRDPFVRTRTGPPAGMPTINSRIYVKALWAFYVHMRVSANGWTVAEMRRAAIDSAYGLGKQPRQRWPEVWGKVTTEDYVVQDSSSSARWRLDVAKVEADLGFTEEAADYFLRNVAGVDPETDGSDA